MSRGGFVRLGSGRIAVGLAAIFVGVLLAVQFRLQQIVPPPTATDQLLALLKSADQKQAQLNNEVAKLKLQLDQKLTEAAAAQKLQNRIIQDEILAGTIPVTGPGVSIVWDNGTAPQGYRISDIDLLLLANELRASGAEAIAINGQRITAQTEIRSANNYILINQNQEAPPFTILAIGNPATLMDGLNLPGGMYDMSKQEGRTMTIQKQKQVLIPAAPPQNRQYISTSTKS